MTDFHVADPQVGQHRFVGQYWDVLIYDKVIMYYDNKYLLIYTYI